MWLSDGAIRHLRGVADAPDTTGTRYDVIEPIGAGGMATVYRARDRRLRREVALKVLRTPELHTGLAARLRREARILARLEHPGIVPIHDAGTLTDGRVFYAMKLVRGRRLDDAIGIDMPILERVRIFRRICEPVAFAHARGVTHRDLKPANIMVGAFGAVLVMDWGAAANAPDRDVMVTAADGSDPGSGRTRHGTRLGTPGWMAPEQERGDTAAWGPRTDVFGLGAILRFLLDRRGAGPAHSTRSAQRALRAVCERALAERPQDRYEDASALAADIDRFLAGEAVLAQRETVWDRSARFYRNYRPAILLVLVYLLMRLLFILLTR